MTSSKPRRKRRPFNGSPADHAPTEQWLSQLRTSPADGTTAVFTGASVIGLPDEVTAIAISGPAPLASYRPAPASFPALPAAPGPEPGPLPQWERDLLDGQARQIALPVLADVPVTEPAVIGDQLRLPVIWCEMPRCISWHLDRESAGEQDARTRARAAGWRDDALGRLACPGCQQSRSDYRTPQPVAWHHPEVRRRWHAREHLTEQDAFRLGVEAELGRRVSYENPGLARAIAGATFRHHKTAATP